MSGNLVKACNILYGLIALIIYFIGLIFDIFAFVKAKEVALDRVLGADHFVDEGWTLVTNFGNKSYKLKCNKVISRSLDSRLVIVVKKRGRKVFLY